LENETISFVEFSSSKRALACVAGINKAKIVDGSFKVYVLFSQTFSVVLVYLLTWTISFIT
jgi:hypothetical protein